MSETRKKKKTQSTEQIPDLDTLILQSREEAKLEELRLKAVRAKLADRDLAAENFLKKEKGALNRYNERRRLQFEIELMREKEIIEEKW